MINNKICKLIQNTYTVSSKLRIYNIIVQNHISGEKTTSEDRIYSKTLIIIFSYSIVLYNKKKRLIILPN